MKMTPLLPNLTHFMHIPELKGRVKNDSKSSQMGVKWAKAIQAGGKSKHSISVLRWKNFCARNRTRFRVAAIALSVLSCGVAVGADVDIDYGKGDPQCQHLAIYIKKAKIGSMTDIRLCQMQQAPVRTWLRDEDIQDLAWRTYSTSDPVQLVRSMIISNIKEKDLPKFEPSINMTTGIARKLAASNNISFETAELNFSSRHIYVLHAEQRRCPSAIGRTDTWFGDGLFLDKDLLHGVRNVFLIPGRLIYSAEGPAVLEIQRRYAGGQSQVGGVAVQLGHLVWDSKVRGVDTVKVCTITSFSHAVVVKN